MFTQATFHKSMALQPVLVLLAVAAQPRFCTVFLPAPGWTRRSCLLWGFAAQAVSGTLLAPGLLFLLGR